MTTTADSAIRLTHEERSGILSGVERACREAEATWRRILLFGSRTDSARRGGDIDLLIELDGPPRTSRLRLLQRLRIALEDTIGEQKVDLLIDDGSNDSAFVAIAREQGVPLWTNG